MARRKDRPGPLEPRSEAILRAIIEEYVATAQPVGSQALVTKYRLGVSPATVRNVMAELEAEGYLDHPHTSAGRLPTDKGYRLYVESITEAVSLAPVEQLMIRHQFGQVEFASEQWFRLAAATLASSTHVAGIATAAKPPSCRVRRVDLVAPARVWRASSWCSPRVPSSRCCWRSTRCRDERDARGAVAGAGRTPDRSLRGGCRAGPRRRCRTPTHPRIALLLRAVERTVRLMRDYDASAVEDVFSEGLLNVMDAPEFSRSETLRRIFGVLQDRVYLGDLMPQLTRDGRGAGVHRQRRTPISRCTTCPWSSRPTAARAAPSVSWASLARRAWHIPHAISTVRYVSGLMNELVDHLYA